MRALRNILGVSVAGLLAVACGSGSKSPSANSTGATVNGGSSGGAPSTFTPAFAGQGPVFFKSPSGNIGCVLDDHGARCDIGQRAWTPPSKPASCDVDFGQGATVLGNNPATLSCAGDTVLAADAILDYGFSAQRGDFVCESDTAAMSCHNTKTGHGFSLSREAFSLK